MKNCTFPLLFSITLDLRFSSLIYKYKIDIVQYDSCPYFHRSNRFINIDEMIVM